MCSLLDRSALIDVAASSCRSKSSSSSSSDVNKTATPKTQNKANTLTNMTKTREDQDTAIPNKTKARLAPRCRQKLL